MKKILFLASAALIVFGSCGTIKKTAVKDVENATRQTVENKYGFPKVNQNGKIAIVAHRGFWKSNAGGMSENSIASLKAAQDAGLWGSECDVHLTGDGIVIVNHNSTINGMVIRENKYSELSKNLLPNGECRPSLDQYLEQTAKCTTTKLVIELKIQKANATTSSEEREDALVDKCLEQIKAHGLYSPERVAFISFSRRMCERIAKLAPEFTNQFLLSIPDSIPPTQIAEKGINGIDYEKTLFKSHGEWVEEAKSLGMSTNVWTVNSVEDMNYQIGLGVDAITTNEPLLLRDLLGKKEFKTAK